MSTAHARRPAPDVHKPKPGADRVARLRPPELSRHFWKRWRGQIPADDDGKRAIRIMLDHLAKIGPDADRRMDNFLELNVAWMTAADRAKAKEIAFGANVFWSSVELGRALGLTYAERCAARITTIRPVDISFEQLVAIQKEKRQRREQDRRLRERMSRKPKASQPARRADAILALLPPDGWWDAGAIVKELRRSKAIAFANLDGDAFRPAVHRAIKHGVTAGMFQTRTASGPKMEKVQIRRAVSR